MWGVASVLGPLAGGYITEHLSWRGVFYINVPIGFIAAVMTWTTFTERHERPKRIALDYAGAGLLSAALTLLLLVVERASEFSLPIVALSVAGCVALFALFVWIEKHSPEPLIPLDLFHSRMVTVTTLHGIFTGISVFGAITFLPLFVQAVMGTNATRAGQILTPMILAWVLTSVIGGWLMLRFGYRPVVIAGMLMFLAGAGLLATVSATTTMWQLSGYVIVMGLGAGLVMATYALAAQRSVPRARTGVATSITLFARSIGSALGAGIMGAVMSWSVNRSLSSGYGAEMLRLSGGHVDIAALVREGTRAALAPDAAHFLQSALADALQLAFVFGFVSALIATIATFFTPAGSAQDLAHPEHD
jgi:MFS family permease